MVGTCISGQWCAHPDSRARRDRPHPEFVGAVSISLGGTRTLYRSSQPRSWPMQWAALTEDQLTYLHLVGLGQVRTPLRLIDPETRNRLSIRIAGGGSYRRSADGFAQTGGSTPTWVAITDPPATVPVRGAVSWERTTTAAGMLTTADTADRVPLIPGEQVRVSTWARGTAIQAGVGYDAWNALGAAATATASPVTLHPTTWAYLDITYTPPQTGSSCLPCSPSPLARGVHHPNHRLAGRTRSRVHHLGCRWWCARRGRRQRAD